MCNGGPISKRWTTVILLLCLQLVSGLLPVSGAHRHQIVYEIQEIKFQMAQQDHLLRLLNKLPVHLEADDDDNGACDLWHVTRHRHKTRWYISAAAPQVSMATRIVYLDTDSSNQCIYLPENKTGEYTYQKSFLPAYYSFLFRFTPF
jgi:hypothetical protein